MQGKYSKDFDTWNNQKKFLDSRLLPDDFFFLEGEIWWAAIGVNVGHETDGKNDLHERPILVLKNINNDLLWALPITSTENKGEHFHEFLYKGKRQFILLAQIRVISSMRLLRLVFRLTDSDFKQIQNKIYSMINSIKTIPSG